jgi:hypothetical protein
MNTIGALDGMVRVPRSLTPHMAVLAGWGSVIT